MVSQRNAEQLHGYKTMKNRSEFLKSDTKQQTVVIEITS